MNAFKIAVLALITGCVSGQQVLSPRDIVTKAVESYLRSNHVRDEYTYHATERQHIYDSKGHLKEQHEYVAQVLRIAGTPITQTITKDGKPLPAKDAEKEQRANEKLAREAENFSPDQLKQKLAKEDRDRAKSLDFLKYIPDAMRFTMLPEQVLNGRPTYVIRADPNPDYHGEADSMYHRVRGTLYIDKERLAAARVDGEFLDNVSFGWFMVKVVKGTRFTFESVRVNDEVWLPKHIAFKADARVLFKGLHMDTDAVFTDYEKFQTSSQASNAALVK